ncbi:hypothetical protein [Streptomyces sp. RTd22]|uniref:hypothetical protein n=1 Tax=Streptomyces sp. RTd22 TaxID=1841249 RepID=UPI001F349C43|nr:hypothetical protein [Streptomyces sp. RTd22]
MRTPHRAPRKVARARRHAPTGPSASSRRTIPPKRFQHLAARDPFTDRALRAELLRRRNELEDIDLPEGKLELRPSFRLSLPEKDHNLKLLVDSLAWFRDRWGSGTAS